MAAASAGARERRASRDRDRESLPAERRTARSPTRRGATRRAPDSAGRTSRSTRCRTTCRRRRTRSARPARTSALPGTPNRPDGVGITQFATESDAVLDRMAAAIHDPATACAASCTNAIAGASFNEGWHDLATWATPTLAIRERARVADRGHAVRAAHGSAAARRHHASRHAAGHGHPHVDVGTGRLLDAARPARGRARSTCPCRAVRQMRSSTTATPGPALRRSAASAPGTRRRRTSRDREAGRAGEASP